MMSWVSTSGLGTVGMIASVGCFRDYERLPIIEKFQIMRKSLQIHCKTLYHDFSTILVITVTSRGG